ncbi:hypothetical protein [Sandaracinus amylolyticus]|uniref:Uncharacterized protein n=1 Tax=Sandaracinus amylolyticus TaxID=927083 RepID=A0A0F6YLX2_9BACT|nr:hypothetical protein [Sandaracinus amylolyticus]AKF08770.1 hypothetical protein DB32_005919 [Sandaracinus amylolyticus]
MTGLTSEPTPAALRLRITAGILYAAARFVPVPLVDDLVRQQIAAWMVRSSVPTTMSKGAIQPLWADDSGCVGGCLGALLWLPIKLLLFPIRKILSIVLGVRWVSRDLAEMLLLGRVIDHALAVGLLQDARDVAEQTQQSREIRTAFDVALKATDTTFLSALIATALGPVRGLVAAAMRTLRSLRRSGADTPTLEGGDKATIETSVSRIEAVLAQPEVKRFLAEFDARVLENLEVLAKRRAPTV